MQIDIKKTSVLLNRKRIEAGCTVKKISDTLDVSEVAIYKWFNPKKVNLPNIIHLHQMAEMYGCKIEDLVVFEKDKD